MRGLSQIGLRDAIAHLPQASGRADIRYISLSRFRRILGGRDLSEGWCATEPEKFARKLEKPVSADCAAR